MAIVTSPSVLTPVPYHVNGAASSESPNAEIRGQLTRISPQMAQDLLKRRLPNRPISKARIKLMIQDMREGRWVMNGEPIILTEDLAILDGQHRLMTVAESGVTVDMMVVVGIDQSAMPSIDQGARRTGVDQLTMQAISNATQLASTARWLSRYEKAGCAAEAVRCATVICRAFVQARPSLPAALSMGRMVRDLLPQSVASMLYFVMRQKNETAAQTFFTELAHGDGLSRDAPAYTARERLLRDKSPRSHINTVARAALITLAWSCLRHGRFLPSTASWKGVSDSTVAFPPVV